jgi:hypothetical protein
MACCAVGPCDRSRRTGGPGCDLCDRVSLLPQPTSHSDRQKRDRAELKASKALPDLSAPRAAAVALGRRKRYRVGPHR